jgi:hypothetical protein
VAGTWEKVLRILSVVALLAVVATGCGGASKSHASADRGVPAALAGTWADQASAIAAAASAGNGCQALHLAETLRHQVAVAKRKLPLRLRSPLVVGVNSLVDRITCTPSPPVTTPKKPPKPPHDKHDDHGHHGHHKHGDGDGSDK